MDEPEKNPPRVTRQAMVKKRKAASLRAIAKCSGHDGWFERREAEVFEREADKLLQQDQAPTVVNGEVISRPIPNETFARSFIRDTLKDGDVVSDDASVTRTDLLLQESFDVVALAVDAADSIQAENSLEKMLAHQMALAHEASFKIMNKALTYAQRYELRQGDSVEVARLSNAAARLMTVYQEGILALQRLRTGGKQTVTVQHVHVNEGAQAVIGDVKAGGLHEGRETKNE